MAHDTLAPHVTATADAILARVGLYKNPYFKALTDGSMSKDGFRVSQEQFYFAVKFFARPMAALVSRMPEPIQRVDLVHNIVEEHGDFHEEQFHQNTFRKFLKSIGGQSPDLAGVPIAPALHAFNSILMGACMSDEIEVGVCCLGIIEQAFSVISAMIGKAVVDRGWLKSGELVHYALHAELDVRHAEEFFLIVEPHWQNPARRIAIQQGLELGAFAFNQLYESMHEISTNMEKPISLPGNRPRL